MTPSSSICLSGSENDESAPDSEIEHDVDCDSHVYVSIVVIRFLITPSCHTEPDFQYPFHMTRPVVMSGVKLRPKRKCASYPSTPFRDYPASTIKECDIDTFRATYNLPESVTLRAPLDTERAHNSRSDEIVVYEAYFAIGFRGIMSQDSSIFHQDSWRVLTAIWRIHQCRCENGGDPLRLFRVDA